IEDGAAVVINALYKMVAIAAIDIGYAGDNTIDTGVIPTDITAENGQVGAPITRVELIFVALKPAIQRHSISQHEAHATVASIVGGIVDVSSDPDLRVHRGGCKGLLQVLIRILPRGAVISTGGARIHIDNGGSIGGVHRGR